MEYQEIINAILVLALLVCIGIVISLPLKKRGQITPKYDERQQAVRGRAFTYGFLTMSIANLIMFLLAMLGLAEKMGSCGYYLPFALGITVATVYGILNDAFAGLNTNINSYMIFIAFLAVINLWDGIESAISGQLFYNGNLAFSAVFLIDGVIFTTILVAFMVKKYLLQEKSDGSQKKSSRGQKKLGTKSK